MDGSFLRRIVFRGFLTGAVALIAFSSAYYSGAGEARARNAAFFALVAEELLRSFSARSETRTIFEMGLFSNMRLIGIVAVSFVLQVLLHTVPMLQSVFETQPVSPLQYFAYTGLAAGPLTIIEAGKFFRRRTVTVSH